MKKTATVDYGTVIVAPVNPDKVSDNVYSYSFASWQGFTAGTVVTGNVNFTAVYTSAYINYTVVFLAKDGNTAIQTLAEKHYGEAVTSPSAPDVTGCSFTGWTPAVSATVTGNATYTVTYSLLNYSVIWKNYDGTVLDTDNVAYGTTPVYNGISPVKASDSLYNYVMSSWTPSVAVVTGNATYTAVFSARAKIAINESGGSQIVDASGTRDVVEVAVQNAKTSSSVTVKFANAQVELDVAALASILSGGNSGADLTLQVAKIESNSLNAQQQAVTRGNVVYEIRLNVNGVGVSAFGSGRATVKLAYSLKEGEKPEGITVWYVTADGALTKQETTYAGGYAVFTVNHFSCYAVGYVEVEPANVGDKNGGASVDKEGLSVGAIVGTAIACAVVLAVAAFVAVRVSKKRKTAMNAAEAEVGETETDDYAGGAATGGDSDSGAADGEKTDE